MQKQATNGARGGPRLKHMPQRMCVACRRSDAKRGLVRVVRTDEGRIEVDPTGKRNGRGAYLCRDAVCWEAALKRQALQRALRVEVLQPDDRAALVAFGKSLALVTAEAIPEEAQRDRR